MMEAVEAPDVLRGSVNSTTNGLSENYEVLVELKGETVALEFSVAFESAGAPPGPAKSVQRPWTGASPKPLLVNKLEAEASGLCSAGLRARQSRTLKIQRIQRRIQMRRAQN